MNDTAEKKEVHICAGCEWCAVEINSNGEYVQFCLCVESEKYLEPVSVADENCEAWEEEKLFE